MIHSSCLLLELLSVNDSGPMSDRNGRFYDKLEELERRSEMSERELSAAINKLAASFETSGLETASVINVLVARIENLIEYNQKDRIWILMLVAAIFFGKEILVHYLTKV